jgi:hypothetical protein
MLLKNLFKTGLPRLVIVPVLLSVIAILSLAKPVEGG